VYYQIADSGKPKDSLEIFRPFAKSVQNGIIDANIKNWIALFDRPFVYPFDERASSEIFSDKRNALFLFTPQGEAGEAVSKALTLIAVDWKLQLKRRLIFTEISVNDILLSPQKRKTKVLLTTSKSTLPGISSSSSKLQKN
jgi:hypothetical protein